MVIAFNRIKIVGWLCVISTIAHASILIQKYQEPVSDNRTVDFSLSSQVVQVNDRFFFGALPLLDQDNQAKNYALMAAPFGSMMCTPLAHETVMLNKEAKQNNPLYNTGILHLGLLATTSDLTYMDQAQGRESQPSVIVVTSKNPTRICLTENIFGHSVYETKDLCDATGEPTKSILKVSGAVGNRPFITAAVTNKEGDFGKLGSGIAVINVSKHVTGAGEVKDFYLGQIDVYDDVSDMVRAIPIDITTFALKIQGDLADIGSIIDMYWDQSLNRLYVTLHVTAGMQEGDGARAVFMVGFTEKGRAYLFPIAPEEVFTGNNQIIGAHGAGESISLHMVRTMWTSMHMPYLVVLGGNGESHETKNRVYALPLVNSRGKNGEEEIDSIVHGTLAAKNAVPIEFYSDTIRSLPSRLLRRAVHMPALTAADIYTSDISKENAPVLVGGGPLKAGDIQQMFIKGDTIHAVVTHSVDGDQPGIYYSQALFDEQGKICAWTEWQRAVQFDNNVHAVALDRSTGFIVTFQGVDKEHIDTVESTMWQVGVREGRIARLNGLLQKIIPQEVGGVQGIFEFPYGTTPGLSNTTLFVATGLNKVVVVPTDHSDVNVARQLREEPARIVTFAGGVLDQIGAITTADIVSMSGECVNPVLVVGGTQGLALLTDDNGNGWDVDASLFHQNDAQHMSFKVLGNYQSVCKVMGDGHFLYILTNHVLDRIDLRDSSHQAVTIARSTDFMAAYNFFHDFLVSRGVVLLATGHGLYITEDENNWKGVRVPGELQGIYTLSAASVTGRAQDVVSDLGGMIYVLSGSHRLNCSALSRFSIKLDDGRVQIRALPDRILGGISFPFILFDTFKQCCVTDGASYLHMSGRKLLIDPLLTGGLARPFVKMPLLLSDALSMTGVLYSHSLGSWIVAGDFGIKGNE